MNLHDIAGRLDRVTWHGDGFTACCPAHEDRNPSLSADLGDDGRVLLRCHAGCGTDAVLTAMNIVVADLFAEKANGNGTSKAQIVAAYDYTDAAGNLLFQVVRMDPKGFRQRRPDGRGGWEWNLKGITSRPLYRLPSVLEAVSGGHTVYVCEGERDAERLQADLHAGEVATTIPGGAGKWRTEHTEALVGADVIVLADRDKPGYAHAAAVQQALEGKAKFVAVYEPIAGKDVADHLGAGHTVDEFLLADLDDTDAKGNVPPEPEVLEASNNVLAEPPDLFQTWTMKDLLAQDLTWEWVVKGMFAHPTFGQIAGELKTLKSYLMTFIILGIASGRQIFDRFTVERPGPVVLYVGEGGRIPWTRRVIRCAEAMGIDHPEDLPIIPTFDVAPVGSLVFDESLARDLAAHEPVLFALDPLYAYHGADVKASDLHQEGAHLNRIRQPVEDAGANLLIANHFNQTGSGNNLKRITQAGSGEWVDSWVLTSHREDPEVNAGKFRLRLEIGSRQWGGTTWDLDLNIGSFDHDAGTHDGEITWEISTGTASAKTAAAGADRAKAEIGRVIRDHPGEMTRTQVLDKIGGNKTTAQQAFDELAEAGVIRWENIPGPDKNGRMITRQRWLPLLSAVPDAEAVK